MRIYFILIGLPLILLSCKEQHSNPLEPTTTKLAILAPSDTINIFPNQTYKVELHVLSGDESTIETNTRHVSDYGSFSIDGPYFSDSSQEKLYVNIIAKQIALAQKVLFDIHYGDQICQVPFVIAVNDFDLIQRIASNCPNDTVVIPRGGSFLLIFTCYDASNHMIPKAQISRLLDGWGYSMSGLPSSNPKFVNAAADRDTVHYDIMFTAFDDITPSSDDQNMKISFNLSNKSITLPIQIKY